MNLNQNAGLLANPFQAWTSLALNSAQMMVSSAEVVALRVQQMFVAGVRPGSTDRAEMGLMGREKVEAAAESAQAMAYGVFSFNQQILAMATRQLFAGLPMMFSLATSFTPSRFAAGQARVVRAAMANSNAATARISTAVPRIAGKGLKPIHSRAAANQRRLAKR